MPERTCTHCGAAITRNDSRIRFCSAPDCQKASNRERMRRYNAENNPRRCDVEGCDNAHRARGLCATHYGQLMDNRHPKVEVPCGFCGTATLKEKASLRKYANVFCGLQCRDQWRYFSKHPSSTLAWTQCERCAKWHTRKQAAQRCCPTPRFVCRRRYRRPCGACGSWCSSNQSRIAFCSERCSKRAGKRRRKAREHGAAGTFDGWQWRQMLNAYHRRCAYCGDKATDLEHVIPLCRGGSNRIANVVPSCRACNIEKGTLTPDEWLASPRPRISEGIAGPHRSSHDWPVGDLTGDLLPDPCPYKASAVGA